MENFNAIGKRCRHYSSRKLVLDGDCCAIGHPIRKIVTEAAGTDIGIAFRLPCHPGPKKAASCPDYDPKTDEEIAADKEAMKAHMDRAMKMVVAAGGWRKKMIDRAAPATYEKTKEQGDD